MIRDEGVESVGDLTVDRPEVGHEEVSAVEIAPFPESEGEGPAVGRGGRFRGGRRLAELPRLGYLPGLGEAAGFEDAGRGAGLGERRRGGGADGQRSGGEEEPGPGGEGRE